ncbi:MAG: ABC transporter ATP-binding protein [Bryobacteraceae bacterium]
MKQSGTWVEMRDVTAGYGAEPVLSGFSLDVPAGELVALLGPSGCGKTTVLRVLAGLLSCEAGEIRLDGERVNELPAERRQIALVFQKPLLFPHLNVSENVGFSRKMRGEAKAATARRVAEALELVQLAGFGDRRPKELSGGQEQRVALARALVSEPRVLLLDEPFSALDENLRAEMRALVRSVQRELGLTTIFVTHDQDEACVLASRIALLLDGRIEQFGAPREFYTAPRSIRAARFFGWFFAREPGGRTVAFRPEAARLCGPEAQAGSGWLAVEAVVEDSLDLGHRLRTRLRAASGETVEIEHAPPGRAAGERAAILIPEESVWSPSISS